MQWLSWCINDIFLALEILLVLNVHSADIAYLGDGYKIKPLHMVLPKTSVFVKRYNGQI